MGHGALALEHEQEKREERGRDGRPIPGRLINLIDSASQSDERHAREMELNLN